MPEALRLLRQTHAKFRSESTRGFAEVASFASGKYADIVACKRSIDRLNRARNDAVERIDELLLAELRPCPGARLNSETRGSMVDRMSIMAIKIRAMRAQLDRVDVDADHLAMCRNRLAVLLEHRADLAMCLDALLDDVRAGRARFKVIRQVKMYNDARLRGPGNPTRMDGNNHVVAGGPIMHPSVY